LGSGLVVATIFLRYHYVIDIVVGSLFAIVTLYTAVPLQVILTKWKEKWARSK
jgi:membrane-associated phospholipid phosphatase